MQEQSITHLIHKFYMENPSNVKGENHETQWSTPKSPLWARDNYNRKSNGSNRYITTIQSTNLNNFKVITKIMKNITKKGCWSRMQNKRCMAQIVDPTVQIKVQLIHCLLTKNQHNQTTNDPPVVRMMKTGHYNFNQKILTANPSIQWPITRAADLNLSIWPSGMKNNMSSHCRPIDQKSANDALIIKLIKALHSLSNWFLLLFIFFKKRKKKANTGTLLFLT